MKVRTLSVALVLAIGAAFAEEMPSAAETWKGKTVGFLGDSITDPNQPNRIYWQYLQETMGIKAEVFAVSGYSWAQMPRMAEGLKAKCGEKVDAILVFIGTNDYNGNRPLGDWFTYTNETVNANGLQVLRRRRDLSFDAKTVRGAANLTMRYLKSNWPKAQIVLMPPPAPRLRPVRGQQRATARELFERAWVFHRGLRARDARSRRHLERARD